MRTVATVGLLLAVFLSCKDKRWRADDHTSIYRSDDRTSFEIRFANDPTTSSFLQDSTLFGSDAKVSIKNIGGLDALEIKTKEEFSDAFIDLEKLFGHTIDFSKARYVSMRIFVPKESWICALKFNFKDSLGNFGGCNEITNNFYENYGQWINVVIDMQEVIPEFKNWQGTENPLPNTKWLSLNPYNAHQADNSVIYVHSIGLSDTKPNLNFVKALLPRPNITPNIPYTLSFDNEPMLKRQMAIRAFESTSQAMATNVGGNPSRAIRLKGKETDKHLAFLPILDKLTGKPVDFTQVKRLHFSYYLTENSADFDGASLFLASEHWNSVLLDTLVLTEFKRGEWQDATIEIATANLKRVRGNESVLPHVYEIRFGLNYRPGQQNIEMWLDNFGWE